MLARTPLELQDEGGISGARLSECPGTTQFFHDVSHDIQMLICPA